MDDAAKGMRVRAGTIEKRGADADAADAVEAVAVAAKGTAVNAVAKKSSAPNRAETAATARMTRETRGIRAMVSGDAGDDALEVRAAARASPPKRRATERNRSEAPLGAGTIRIQSTDSPRALGRTRRVRDVFHVLEN